MARGDYMTNRARVSIAERLVPALSYAVAAVSGAFGALLTMQFLDALRNAETAGMIAFFRGTSEIELAMGIMLGISAALGACGILVSVIRMFTTNTTASPPGVMYLVVGLLSLVPPFAVHYALHTMEHAVMTGVEGGISSVGATVTALSYFAPVAAFVMIIVLLAFSFVPFTSRAGRKFSSLIFLIVVEIAILGLAAVSFWQAAQATSTAGRFG